MAFFDLMELFSENQGSEAEEAIQSRFLAVVPHEAITCCLMRCMMALVRIIGPERTAAVANTVAEKIRREARAQDNWDEARYRETLQLSDAVGWPEHLQGQGDH